MPESQYISITPITGAMLISSSVPEPDPYVGEVDWSSGTSYDQGDLVIRTTTHRRYSSLRGERYVVTISHANPGVVALSAHGLEAGTAITFTNAGGALPAPLAAATPYYAVNPGESSFQVSTTVDGDPIETTTDGSGTHTLVISTNQGKTPENEPLYWFDEGPTNQWAMFDFALGTRTVAEDEITVVVAPGLIDSLAACELVGDEASIVMSEGGYDETVNLDATQIYDYYPYFTRPFMQRSEFAKLDLGAYYAAETTFTVTGSGEVACGFFAVGLKTGIGLPLADGAAGGIDDYSEKTTANGQSKFVEGPYARDLELKGALDDIQYNEVFQLFARKRATPGVLVGVPDNPLYDWLISPGIAGSFKILPQHPVQGYCVLTWKGLL